MEIAIFAACVYLGIKIHTGIAVPLLRAAGVLA